LNKPSRTTWKQELSSRLKTAAQFAARFGLAPLTLASLESRLAFGLTPYYANLCEQEPALLRSVLPSPLELTSSPFELQDPMVEERDSPVPCIVRRYPNRALFLLTPHCPVYCRYCTRARKVGKGEHKLGKAQWQEGLDWLKEQPQIEEVILSGGEPLLLGDSALGWLLGELARLPQIRFLRFSTKAVATLPQRITPGLAKLLGRHQPLLLNLHFVHPAELTAEVALALSRLRKAGVMLASQTVLLQGVNDDPQTLAALFKGLYGLGVRPYALYLCDWITGASHFRVGPTRALELMGELRQSLSGVMLPKLIADPPGGKVDLATAPEPGEGGVWLTNWKGERVFWPEP